MIKLPHKMVVISKDKGPVGQMKTEPFMHNPSYAYLKPVHTLTSMHSLF